MKKFEFLKNKKVMVFSIIALVALVFVFLSSSYALFSKRLFVSEVDIKVGELNYSLASTSLNANNQITVDANTSVQLNITIKSLNETSSKYELYYSTPSENVVVGTSTIDTVKGEIAKEEEKMVSVKITNNDTSSQTVTFGVEGGLFNNELILSKGTALVEEEVGEPIVDKLFATENLGESCKTYDDGVDTFLVGQCQNNYVWYSGKLWRVVLKNNETGAVKMITDNAITSISYNASNNTSFENSYVDQWLNQDFLLTLHDASKFLVEDSVWDATMSTSSPTRPNGATTVNRTVGLLNTYEQYTTYNNSDGLATSNTGYLNVVGSPQYWWLITPYNATSLNVVEAFGYTKDVSPTVGYAVRPVVNFKSNLRIISGSGIKTDPYRLAGDVQETINGTTLLNTKYSGEYIRFNNELYRIVEVEDGLTKIIAVYHPTALANIVYDSGVATYFAGAEIKTTLENYYQGLNTISKNMIQTNATWYIGRVGVGESYKLSICSTAQVSVSTSSCNKTSRTVRANIALPRLGEMFSAPFERSKKNGFWTLNQQSKDDNWYVEYRGILGYATQANTYSARPSMYLKQNVVIAKDNTGDGTYEHPYDIELGS